MESTAVCEGCGATFAQSSSDNEVVSARVLCPKCEALKRAERAAKAGARRTAAPAAAPAAAARTREEPRTARPAPPSRSPARAPASARHQPAEGGGERHHHLEELEGTDKLVKIGWIAALSFLVIGGVVLFIVLNTHAKRRQEKDAYENSLTALHNEITAANLDTMAGAESVLSLAAARKDLWKGSRIAAIVQDAEGRAKRAIEHLKEQAETERRMGEINAAIANASNLSVDQLLATKNQILELQPRVRELGPEVGEKLKANRAELSRTIAARVSADALRIAAEGPNGAGGWRPAMNALARAEDETFVLATQAVNDNDKEGLQFYNDQLKRLIAESDAFGAKVFTADFIDKAPWRDLIGAGMNAEWIGAGLDWRLDGGKLTVLLAADAAKKGILSTKPQWRDFILDAELSLDRGKAEIYFRVRDKADSTVVPSLKIGPEGQIPAPPGATVNVTISVIGSKLRAQLGDNVLEEDIAPRKSRVGNVAIVPDKGVTMTITRLRIRELR